MSFDPAIQKIANKYKIIAGDTQGIDALLARKIKAQPKTELVLDEAGFKWNPNEQIYVSDRNYQSVAAMPERVYVWLFDEYVKLLGNTNELKAWLEDASFKFIEEIHQATGAKDPVKVSGPSERPPQPSSDDKIQQIIKTVKAGSKLPSDRIIDLYKLAKSTNHPQLMDLVKTLQIQENTVKTSALKNIIREIVRGVFKEMSTTGAAAPVTTPSAFSKRSVDSEEETLDEMTTTGDVQGYNIPSAFSRKGGSKKGLDGSAALGYDLTPTGKKEMNRLGDPLQENVRPNNSKK